MPSPTTRWRRRKDARPPEILAAALASFVERGYAATRLEDVARRAGVTKGTLYLYFPNKAELFKAVVREALVPTLARVGAASQTAPSATALFAGALRDFERLAASPAGAIPKLVLAEAGNFPEIARFYLDEVAARGLAAIRALLERGVATGEFRAVDLDYAPFCVIAPLVLGLLWMNSLGRVAERPLDLAALGQAHLDLLLDGLRPREPA
jgi:AcrR family transcriptional regulator